MQSEIIDWLNIYLFSPRPLRIRVMVSFHRARQHRNCYRLLRSFGTYQRPFTPHRAILNFCHVFSRFCQRRNAEANASRGWCELMRKQCMLLRNGAAIDGAKRTTSLANASAMRCAVFRIRLRHQVQDNVISERKLVPNGQGESFNFKIISFSTQRLQLCS